MHQYPWICLNILENAWKSCSDYVRALDMSDHLTCSTEDVSGSNSARVLNMSLLYMQRLRGVPNMSDYVSIRLNNVWLCLSMHQHDWILLNVPWYAWIDCSNYARVLSMMWYSYNNAIIIVANVIVFEFLSARFGRPDSLLSFYLRFNTSCNIRRTKASKLLINFSFRLQWHL